MSAGTVDDDEPRFTRAKSGSGVATQHTASAETRSAAGLASLGRVIVDTGMAPGPRHICVQRRVQPTQTADTSAKSGWNHNPKVGGSRPSSGMQLNDSARVARLPRAVF
jgi:hypothetical protein